MDFFQAVILGIIEGATEYLPISSTFHLIWASKLLSIPQTEFQKMFEVVIQSGAILAVLVLYFKTLTHDSRLLKKVFASFLPTAVIGLVLYKIIKNVFFESYLAQIGIFILVGLLFLVIEQWWNRKKFTVVGSEITYSQAIVIGLAQALAVFPGVSRAGAVILAMMFFNVRRDEAAKYSFILAVPTLLAAAVLDLFKSRSVIFEQANLLLLLVGFITSFISALVVVRWFIGFLERHKITLFGWYRLAFGLILAIMLMTKIF
jgi:undecaprenyl-diphosphatase